MTLIELAEKVERASGADRELDCLIAVAVNAGSALGAYKAISDCQGVTAAGYVQHHFEGSKSLQEAKRYTASLDAAMSLVPEGFVWTINTFAEPERAVSYLVRHDNCYVRTAEQFCATPALALVAAALRARATQDNG